MASLQIVMQIVALTLLGTALYRIRLGVIVVLCLVIRALRLRIYVMKLALAIPPIIVEIIAVMANSRSVMHFHPIGVIVVVMFPVPHHPNFMIMSRNGY